MKKFTALLTALLLCAVLCMSAWAAEPGVSHVTDEARLLTNAHRETLEATASALSEQYGIGVYALTVQNYRSYGYSSIEQCAEALYNEYELGLGEEHNGVLLLLSMSGRDYDLCVHGTAGNAAFTDYGRELLCRKFLDDFGDDDWYGGFSDYLKQSGKMLSLYAKGHPLDRGSVDVNAGSIAVALAMGALLAWLVCLILKAPMRSVRKAAKAEDYLPRGAADFYVRDDIYTHTTVSRRQIPKPSSSGGGGSGGGGSGFSHSSGKF